MTRVVGIYELNPEQKLRYGGQRRCLTMLPLLKSFITAFQYKVDMCVQCCIEVSGLVELKIGFMNKDTHQFTAALVVKAILASRRISGGLLAEDRLHCRKSRRRRS